MDDHRSIKKTNEMIYDQNYTSWIYNTYYYFYAYCNVLFRHKLIVYPSIHHLVHPSYPFIHPSILSIHSSLCLHQTASTAQSSKSFNHRGRSMSINAETGTVWYACCQLSLPLPNTPQTTLITGEKESAKDMWEGSSFLKMEKMRSFGELNVAVMWRAQTNCD